MKAILLSVFTGLFPMPLMAQTALETPVSELFIAADTVDLNELVWKKRPVVIFADSTDDPAYIEQLKLLEAQSDELIVRDVIVVTDTDPAARGDLRLKLRPRGFMLALIGKDGDVKIRKPFPWSVREITRSIDKMTIRKREIREQKTAGPAAR
ncbi:hypothetical protein C1J03_16530 [Sulfitobacter sp. SK012]|uniref:DUF4174 domain-containing protein n=1 Tax=Sulfitobacter sp. SK012 TaxID=1389005 RepID=UPI000E0C8206|nr:DUF4174 domain-containing protein [Sulfitobacter sp. SK012]AXI47470.1 hypothetical protein C1J03_16530 [Sulfitobacter sp. SK012]